MSGDKFSQSATGRGRLLKIITDIIGIPESAEVFKKNNKSGKFDLFESLKTKEDIESFIASRENLAKVAESLWDSDKLYQADFPPENEKISKGQAVKVIRRY
jgi:hypothetical protein